MLSFVDIVRDRVWPVWVKTSAGWIEHKPQHLLQPGSQATARAAPPSAIGHEGSIFDETNARYYTNEQAFIAAVTNPEEEAMADTSILTTRLESEHDFLISSPTTGAILFSKDETGTYSLWSTPNHIAQNMINDLPGVPFKEISGERAAEEDVESFLSFMMKQTLEHFEALTVMRLAQGDEQYTLNNIISQYGSDDPTAFKLDRINALHNPRPPVFEEDFSGIIGSLERYIDNVADDSEQAEAELMKAADKLDLGFYMAPILEILKDQNVTETKEKRAKDFMSFFLSSRHVDRIYSYLETTSPKFRTNDAIEEVTRVRKMEGCDYLVGYHQAVFYNVWGQKSAAVMVKAASLGYAITSSGLRYHNNPGGTVQVTEEYPAYIKTIEALSKRTANKGLKTAYSYMARNARSTLETMNGLEPRGALSYRELGELRDPAIAQIRSNSKVLDGLAKVAKKRSDRVLAAT